MDKFCRICSRSDEFQRFEISTISQISNVRIDDMLVYCTQQQISIGDSLPQHICAECFAALNSAFVFRKLTYHSENEFRAMIDSNSNDSVFISSGASMVPMPVEMTDHVLHDVAIKTEEIEVEEPLVRDIFPVENKTEWAADEDTSIAIANNVPAAKCDKRTRSFSGQTTYLCKDCGYATQHCFNFKRHQKNQKHSTYSKLIVKRPISMIKQLIKPFIKAPKPPPSRQRKAEKKNAAGLKPRRNCIRTRYRCDDCGYQNYVAYNFRRHQKTWNHKKVTTFNERILDSEPNIAKCLDCSAEFISEDSLIAHCKTECKLLDNGTSGSDYILPGIAPRSVRRRTAQLTMTDQIVEVKREPIDSETESMHSQGNSSTQTI